MTEIQVLTDRTMEAFELATQRADECARELVLLKRTLRELRLALPGQSDPSEPSQEDKDKVSRYLDYDPAVTLTQDGTGSAYRGDLYESYSLLGGTLSARRFYATLRALGYREGKTQGLHRFYGITIYED